MSSDGSPRRGVLIADQDEDQRTLAVTTFKMLGCDVHSARHGAQALALLEANPPIGMLVTDVRLPDMSGIELAKAAIRMRATMEVIFVAAEPREVVWTRRPAVLRKPYSVRTLIKTVVEVIGSSTPCGVAADNIIH